MRQPYMCLPELGDIAKIKCSDLLSTGEIAATTIPVAVFDDNGNEIPLDPEGEDKVYLDEFAEMSSNEDTCDLYEEPSVPYHPGEFMADKDTELVYATENTRYYATLMGHIEIGLWRTVAEQVLANTYGDDFVEDIIDHVETLYAQQNTTEQLKTSLYHKALRVALEYGEDCHDKLDCLV